MQSRPSLQFGFRTVSRGTAEVDFPFGLDPSGSGHHAISRTRTRERARLQRKIEVSKTRFFAGYLCALQVLNYDEVRLTFGRGFANFAMAAIESRMLNNGVEDVYAIAPGRIAFLVWKTAFSSQHFLAQMLAECRHLIPGASVRIIPQVSIGMVDLNSIETDADGYALLLNQAMFAAGAQNGTDSGITLFDREEYDRARRNHLLMAELPDAIAAGELDVVFQPIVDGARRVVAAEALVRWHHPEHGLLNTGEFIGYAERYGLSPRIATTVCATVSRRIAERRRLSLKPLKFSMNVSASDLRCDSLPETLMEIVRNESADPALIQIEVTERSAVDHDGTALDGLKRLDRNGFPIALDDFGVGATSLRHLLNLPLSTIKVDRCFATGIDKDRSAQSICQGLVHICRNMDLDLVAEGVETPAEFEVLRALGFKRFQGYLFGRPGPYDELSAE